jgi:transcriptional regulator with XRE-family HTH domain
MSTIIMGEITAGVERFSFIFKSMKSETLEAYVRRVMNAKNLKPGDVQRKSKGRVSDSYVGNILSGQARNLTVEKLKALAVGLGVDEEELFFIVRGSKKPADDSEFRESLYYMLYEKAKAASPEKRELIKSVLKMIDRELDDDISKTS